MPYPIISEDETPSYTYADYLEWDDGKRYELLNGEAFMMAAPSAIHQFLSMELSTQFHTFLRGKPCRVLAAPFDVRLFPQEGDKDKTVVQPDLLVICDREKLKDKRACKGAPDLAIEIASPSDAGYILLKKFNYYLEAGVREYWVINPDDKAVQVHILEENHYRSSVYHENDTITVSVLPGLSIELKTLWDAME